MLLLVPSFGITAVLLLYKATAPGALIYDPLSRLRMYFPPFDPMLGLTLISLVVPALVLWAQRRTAGSQIEVEATTG